MIYLNSYHKLYRQLDIPRIEDSLTEIKNKQTNKQTKTILSTPNGSQSQNVYDFWLVLFVCFLDILRLGRLVESQAIQRLGSFCEKKCFIWKRRSDKLINLCNIYIKSVMQLHGWHGVHTNIFQGLLKDHLPGRYFFVKFFKDLGRTTYQECN